AMNKELTQAAVQSDLATVGSFSLVDSFGGKVLAANPQMPDISVAVDPATLALPNTFSPFPATRGWPLGPLVYFKQRFPEKIAHTGAIVANLPSTLSLWDGERAAMGHLGYNVAYSSALPATTTDFTSQVVAMKNMGIQVLFLEQAPQNYAAAVIKDLQQQNFHPVVVLGGSSYSSVLVPDAGGPAAIDGTYLEQSASLYLGGDAATIPAVRTFDAWVQAASPGFHADFFTLYGWLSAELFVQALRHAGSDPSRGSLLEALRHITSFSSDSLVPVSDPARKIPISCYIIGQIRSGQFVRVDDPPISGPTHGFRCDEPYYYLR
ncbi:MAG: ABC transporter substrate-binding protein, partial [Acidimicrobiales bacterium]|nr:ABC transporter substrate-binding protein [Acidimicrobiales bacterium]